MVGFIEHNVNQNIMRDVWLNSFGRRKSSFDFMNLIFNDLLTDIFRFSCNNALRLIPRHINDDKSTLVQMMAWWRQASSHYLS